MGSNHHPKLRRVSSLRGGVAFRYPAVGDSENTDMWIKIAEVSCAPHLPESQPKPEQLIGQPAQPIPKQHPNADLLPGDRL